LSNKFQKTLLLRAGVLNFLLFPTIAGNLSFFNYGRFQKMILAKSLDATGVALPVAPSDAGIALMPDAVIYKPDFKPR
jgi:hypothetical protein